MRRNVAVLLLACWWGGFTFYALAVVPTGHAVLRSKVRQGFITEQVTTKLNWLGVAALAVAATELAVRRGERRWFRLAVASWLAGALTLGGLFLLHHVLSGQLDFANRTVTDEEHFYGWHRAYLSIATVQWFAGLGLLLALVSDRGEPFRSQTPP